MKPTIEDFKDWLEGLGIAPEFLETVQSEDLKGESRTLAVILHMWDAAFRINVVYRQHDDGWMGCREVGGKDLTSGPFTFVTWDAMSEDFKGHRLMRLTQVK